MFSFGPMLTYHAAIDTINGLKYSYLPRRKHLTLSQLAIILCEDFITDTHHKYLYRNYRMLPTYRKYNEPTFMDVLNKSLYIACNSQKFCDEDILTRDTSAGLFTLQRVLAKLIPLILALHQVYLCRLGEMEHSVQTFLYDILIGGWMGVGVNSRCLQEISIFE